MKLIYTLEEVRTIIANDAAKRVPGTLEPGKRGEGQALVRFIHKHSDGSGDMDVEDITDIDRVEVML